jgi:hypothetical protein
MFEQCAKASGAKKLVQFTYLLQLIKLIKKSTHILPQGLIGAAPRNLVRCAIPHQKNEISIACLFVG